MENLPNFSGAKEIPNEFRPQRARPHHPLAIFFQNSLLTLFLLLAATVPALAQIPSKVTLSRAHTPTADGFTVAWSDLSNETAYHLEHTTSANFTSATLITNISANATSRTLTGLTPGTTYYVRVRGAAAGGNGTWSDVQANQLLSIDPGQTRYLSVAGVPHGASHSVNFTISDVFGSANSAGLVSGTTSSEASTILLLGSNGSTAHTVFYNSSANQWREGADNKGAEIVGFGKGFMVRNNTSTADIFLLSGSVPQLEPGAVTVFPANAPAGRLSLVSPPRTMATSLRSLGLTHSNNTTTGLKRATTAKDADLLLIPDSAGGLRRYHFDGTNWRSGLRTVSDPSAITVPPGGAFFLRKASGSSFQQWRTPLDIVTDGLVLLLDAGNSNSYNGSGTTWTDLSGNENNGTLINEPTYSSQNGGSIVFDGVNDYVAFANTTIGGFSSANFSYGAWFYYSGVSQSSTIITKRNDSPWNQYGMNISNDATNGGNGTKLTAFMNPDPSTTGHGTYSTFNYELGSNNGWYFGLVTNNFTQQRMYVNGVHVLTDNDNHNGGTFLVAGRPLYIGASNFNSAPGLFFKSSNISTVFLYNRALIPQEVLQIYNATKGRYEIVKDGLVLHLDAGNLASYPGNGTAWRDLSGNGYNGTLTNGPTFNSSNGGSIVFDGVNDFVSMDNKNPAFINSTFPNGLTIGFAIRLTNPFPTTSDGRSIITRNSGSNGSNAFNLSIQANRKLRFWINSSSSPPLSTTTLNTNQIYICTLVWDRSHARFYLQGVLDSTTAYSPTPTVSNHTRFNIGYWGDAGWEFPGDIYNIVFYDRVLSEQEIQQNFNALKGRYGL